MAEYSVVVSTFLRPEKLRTCLSSVAAIDRAPESVVVVDDGGDVGRTEELCADLKLGVNLTVVELPYDAGLAAKRNRGIAEVDEDFVLLLDDDQYPPTNVHELTAILEENPTVGGVAPYWEERGQIRANAADYSVRNGWLIKAGGDREPTETDTGHVIFLYDHIPNAAMFRTAVFDDYGWDEGYVIYEEDTDFYYAHRELGRWAFAVTPNYVLRHDPGPGTKEAYETERNDPEKMCESYDRLSQKFGLKGVFHFGSHVPPRWPLEKRVATWLARHVVPYRVLWWLKMRGFGDSLRRTRR